MHAFRKLRARIFRIRKTRVYDTARSVCTKALGAFRKKEKKKRGKRRRVIGGKYRSKNGP